MHHQLADSDCVDRTFAERLSIGLELIALECNTLSAADARDPATAAEQHGVQGMLRALHGLAVTLGASVSGTAELNHHDNIASTRESKCTATNEAGEFCRLAAECVRRVQTTVRKVAEVAKEHALPPRNPLPYILGYSASAAFVAGCIYYNRTTLFPRLQSAASWLREVSKDFTTVHVVEPVKNIYTELVYRYALRSGELLHHQCSRRFHLTWLTVHVR
eukprot:COSAG02_NODE_2181_length_9586_cov_3.262254_3_plen_219_part_00